MRADLRFRGHFTGVLFLRRRDAFTYRRRWGRQPKDQWMNGKTIVATGATSGIGEAAVLELARLGGRIVIVARDEARAQATMRKLEARRRQRAIAHIWRISRAWPRPARSERRSLPASRASTC
jgi:hypothetical protein